MAVSIVCRASCLLVIMGITSAASITGEDPPPEDYYAVCNMEPTANEAARHGNLVRGRIGFKTKFTGDCSINLMKFNLTGFNTRDRIINHGFTVLERGDLTNSCVSMGGHYNPIGGPHGRSVNVLDSRHMGDLGNIVEEEGGVVTMDMVDWATSVGRDTSFVGQGLAIYQKYDNGAADGGNAGDVIACCVVGLFDPDAFESWPPFSPPFVQE